MAAIKIASKAEPANGPAAKAVREHIAKLPPWQRGLAQRIDAIVAKEVPGVERAIKWHSIVYGVPGKGLFAILSAFKAYVKVNFYRGASLDPVPPSGVGKEQRSLDIKEGDDLDEEQLASWVRQAARLPGFGA
jgi:hypothetical protein